MFGKGHKRKLDEDEAGLEGKALEAAEGLSKVSYTLQRQTIFNISLMKLYATRPGEPSLQRRVLINNMLRRIQDELKQDGTLRPLVLPPSPPPDDPLDEGYRQAPPPFGVLGPPPPLSPHPMGSAASPLSPAPPLLPSAQPPAPQDCPLEACLTPASLLEDDNMESMENATFSVAPSPPTPPVSPRPVRLQPSMELDAPTTRTLAASSAALTVSTSLLSREHHRAKPEAAGVLQAELRLLDSLPTLPSGGGGLSDPPSASSAPSGFLSDLALDDVLFADIDTSMYDFDPCTTTTTSSSTTGSAAILSSGGGITKMAPVVTADDLIKSLASPYSGPAPQVSPNQPFKIDLTELDHIMEVLVGS